jgi:cellobiose transport system substrate-binding protein
MQTPRRTPVAIAALAACSVLVLSACGGSGDTAAPAAGGPVDLKVNLFGTFGYQELGLFEEYEKAHPGVTISYESTQDEDKYWPALQTRMASGAGVADVQGIEVSRIADVVANQPDQWTDLRDTPAADAIGRYIDWKEPAATTPDGAVLGLGTDIGPMGMCYRSDLLQQAGLPTDPTQLAAQMSTWDAYLALGETFKAKAPAGTAWADAAGGIYDAMTSQLAVKNYDKDGKLIFDSNPDLRSRFDTAAKAAQAGLTAKLEQFADPGWDQGFSSGSYATIACPSWMIGYIKGKAGDGGSGKWNITSLPGGAGGNWGGSYLAIPESSQHKTEAAELISWLTAPEQQARLFEKVGNFPSTKDGIAKVSGTTDPYFNNAPIGKIFSDSANAAPVQILGAQDGVIKNEVSQALLSVETAGVTPDAAWATAVNNVKNQAG